MSFVWFTPENKAWAMQVPRHWDMEADDGTYTWYDPCDWKGNFRVTVYTWSDGQGGNEVQKFLDEECAANEGAERKKYGEFDAVTYIKRQQEEENKLSIFYFTLAKGHYVFMFSFTVTEENEQRETTKSELETIDMILRSLQVHAAGRG